MPLDPNISLGVNPGQAAGNNLMGNPMDMMYKMAATTNAMNQNKLFQQQFGANQAMGQISQNALAGATGADGTVDLGKAQDLQIQGALADPRAAFKTPELMASAWQRKLNEANISKTDVETAAKLHGIIGTGLQPWLKDDKPGSPAFGMAGIDTVIDSALNILPKGAAREKFASTVMPLKENMLKQIGPEPKDDGTEASFNARMAWKDKARPFIQSIAAHADVTSHVLDGILGVLQTDNLGGKIQTSTVDRYTDTKSPLMGSTASQPIGLSPNTAAEIDTKLVPRVTKDASGNITPITDTFANTFGSVGGGKAPAAPAGGFGGSGLVAGGASPQLPAQPSNALPAPPSAGGPLQTDLPKGAEDTRKELATYAGHLGDQLDSQRSILENLGAQKSALQNFKGGPGSAAAAEVAAKFVAIARLGRPQDATEAAAYDAKVDKIKGEVIGGDLGAAQFAFALSQRLAFAFLKADLTAQGRPNMLEFSSEGKSALGPTFDPKSIDLLEGQTKHLYALNRAKADYLAHYVQNSTSNPADFNLSRFHSNWHNQLSQIPTYNVANTMADKYGEQLHGGK